MDDIRFHFRLRGEDEFDVWNDHCARDPEVAAKLWLERRRGKTQGIVEYSRGAVNPSTFELDKTTFVIGGFKKGDFVTNFPKSIKAFWPRRQGVRYTEGPARGTEEYSHEQLAKQGLVGIYVDGDYPDYWDRRRVYPEDYREED